MKFFAFLVSPLTWLVVLGFGGLALIVCGVRLLVGDGPAFIVAGVALIVLAHIIRRGISNA